jgi:4-alpha-glucanotransferase
MNWTLETDIGKRRRGAICFGDLPLSDARQIDGRMMERRILTLPFPLMIGRHRLVLRLDSGEQADLPLIVAPRRCYLPQDGTKNPRLWGVTLQLYGLRSERNWGIGDFCDLGRMVEIMAPLGAAAIGLNPLHAMFPNWPNHRSPYSPSHRQFLAVHYLSVETIDDFAECEEARRIAASDDFRQKVAAAQQTSLMDYGQVLALKRPIFDLLYRSFREHHLVRADDSRAQDFRAYQKAKGESLRRFALFEALSDKFKGEPWRNWPVAFHDPDSPETAAFAAQNRERVEFHQYLQWQAERQIGAAQDAARASGMTLGLYHDLALAPDGSGAEMWANQRLFARGATLGAPPDLWNQLGQNWGLPPYAPRALRADAYNQWSSVIRALMSRGGGLRIDHAIGLERMFWIPEGAGPADGGYVRYPVDELFGVLALESVRQESLIVGEDLGTLPEGFHDRMKAAAMLSYRLLYFEQDKRGEFLAPRRYPPLAAVAVTTHDLATLAGYWTEHDLQVRDTLTQFPSDAVRATSFKMRQKDRQALIRALKREGVLSRDTPDNGPLTDEILVAVYRFIARTPSLLMLLCLEDVSGEKDQANLPGTVDQHPNWQRKLSLSMEAMKDSARLRALVRAIAEERSTRHVTGVEKLDAVR